IACSDCPFTSSTYEHQWCAVARPGFSSSARAYSRIAPGQSQSYTCNTQASDVCASGRLWSRASALSAYSRASREPSVTGPLRRGVGDVGQKGRAQRADDGAGDLVLDREHVVQRTIVALRPKGASVVGGSELRRDAQTVSGLPHRALQHGGDAEQRADPPDVLRLSLEGERGRARGDAQTVDLGERVDQLVADAVAQVLVVRIGAGIHERQHRDGARPADQRRGGSGSRLFQGRRELGD